MNLSDKELILILGGALVAGFVVGRFTAKPKCTCTTNNEASNFLSPGKGVSEMRRCANPKQTWCKTTNSCTFPYHCPPEKH